MNSSGNKHYIIGYGTLLYTQSLGDTLGSAVQHKEYLPVVLSGFKRVFNILPPHYKPSFRISRHPVEKAAANIIRSEAGHFNGLAFEVDEDEMIKLDRRERHYQRVEVPMLDFESRKSIGTGYAYIAEGLDIITSDPSFLPDWEDISWARTGAYRISQAFGKMYDETSFLADGKTLVTERYHDYLDQLIIKR